MRNLVFLSSADVANPAAAFRRAFMEKTAVWNVMVKECATKQEAQALLDAKQASFPVHAYVAAPKFRSLLFEEGYVKGASAKLSQGADVMYRGGSDTIALAQLARCVVDCIEHDFIPIYGAKVTILGSGSAALDMAYECSRAGVDEVTILDEDKARAQDNLSSFLDAFERNRSSILDTEASRTGHLSALRSYEHTAFLFGSLGAKRSVSSADLVFSFLTPSQVHPDYTEALRPEQIVCDPWGRSEALLDQAKRKGCDVVSWRDAMAFWGNACAELLIEFGNANLR